MKYIVLDIETTGLDPITKKITCICAKTDKNDGFKFASKDEKEILSKFANWLSGKKGTLLTKNGLMFDIPFIIVRSAINKMDKLNCLLDFEQEDIQTYTQGRVKLDDMALLLGTTNKIGDGCNAIKLFDQGYLDLLEEYCYQDVKVTEDAYLKMIELGIIEVIA